MHLRIQVIEIVMYVGILFHYYAIRFSHYICFTIMQYVSHITFVSPLCNTFLTLYVGQKEYSFRYRKLSNYFRKESFFYNSWVKVYKKSRCNYVLLYIVPLSDIDIQNIAAYNITGCDISLQQVYSCMSYIQLTYIYRSLY